MKSGFNEKEEVEGKWYICSMASNHYSSNTSWKVMFTDALESSAGTHLVPTEICNGIETGFYDGFNIDVFENVNADNNDMSKYLKFDLLTNNAGGLDFIDLSVGALSFGKVFDMPISSDVSMKMSYEYGVEAKETKYGSTISNVEWWQKPEWNGRPAWELYSGLDVNTAYQVEEDLAWRKSGRRVYDLSFTFLSSDDMLATSGVLNSETLAENQYLNDTTVLTDRDENNTTRNVVNSNISIKNDYSFYAQVVHKTMGFSLPFIFQPNKDYNKPDGFMFARVDEKDYQLEQLAPDLWRAKMKIREVW